MNEIRSDRNSDIHWVVGGAVFLLITGMALVTVASILVPDPSTLITSIGSMVAIGVAGIFGLWKVNENTNSKIDANTALTQKVSTETLDISKQLNGNLDTRIREIVTEVVYEALAEWTAPTAVRRIR